MAFYSKTKVKSFLLILISLLVLPFLFQNCGKKLQSLKNSTSLLESSYIQNNVILSEPAQQILRSQLGQSYQNSRIFQSTANTDGCEIDIGNGVLTHYDDVLGEFKIGGRGIKNINRTHQEIQADLNLNQQTVYNYADSFLPLANHYEAQNYDIYKMTDSEWISRLSSLCSSTIKKVKVVDSKISIQNLGDLRSLIDDNYNGYIILNSIVYKKNLFTVILPPNWSKQKKYTTLISGNYSVNLTLQNDSQFYFGLMSLLFDSNQHGFITILWNGGATIASRTFNEQAYVELNEFLKIAIQDLSLDSQKFISFGASRGGSTALNIAASPSINSINVVYVHSIIPPIKISTYSDAVSTTLPLSLGVMDASTGIVHSWKTGAKVSASVSAVQRQMEVLTGTDSINIAQNQIDLDSSTKLNLLKSRNTQIFLELGSHDFILPFNAQKRFVNKLIHNGIRFEARVNYIGGHSSYAPHAQLLYDVINRVHSASDVKNLSLVRDSRVSNYLPDVNDGRVYNSWTYKTNPLTLEFPRIVTNTAQNIIFASGEKFKKYELNFYDELNAKYSSLKVNLDEWGGGEVLIDESFVTNRLRLDSVFEIDTDGRKISQIKFLTTLKDNQPIIIEKLDFSSNLNTADFSIKIAEKIFSGTYPYLENVFGKTNQVNSVFYNFTNLGVVEVSEQSVPMTGVPAPRSVRSEYCDLSVSRTELYENEEISLTVSTKNIQKVLQNINGHSWQPLLSQINTNQNALNEKLTWKGNSLPPGDWTLDYKAVNNSGAEVSCNPQKVKVLIKPKPNCQMTLSSQSIKTSDPLSLTLQSRSIQHIEQKIDINGSPGQWGLFKNFSGANALNETMTWGANSLPAGSFKLYYRGLGIDGIYVDCHPSSFVVTIE